MHRFLIIFSLVISTLSFPVAATEPFNHNVWNHLLKSHVSSDNNGASTTVDYDGFLTDRASLKKYLNALSKIDQITFNKWSLNEQLAFLINAYNAWTVEFILTAWPNIESIKELGSFFRSPWKKRFVPLLGNTISLDDLEHGLIRDSDRYNDPRIHFAVNCASIGCPALRSEAYAANRLDAQFNEQTKLFLSDRSRNRATSKGIEISAIFKWYRSDFEKGWQGYNRLEDFIVSYADALSLTESMTTRLKSEQIKIQFLDYDWRLNKS